MRAPQRADTFPELRARVRREALVVAALVAALAVASVAWELPGRLAAVWSRGGAWSLVGHILVLTAGSHLFMIVFGARRGRDLKRAVRHNEQLALHDDLTGLPNRALLFDRLEQALALARRDHGPVGVMVLDLDGFKEINDTRGHRAGDAVLQQVAARLSAAARETDTVARVGGDEFVVLVVGAADDTAVERMATRLCATFAEPFPIDGDRLRVTTSIGVAVTGAEPTTPEDLVRRADAAMYAAKRSRGGSARGDEA